MPSLTLLFLNSCYLDTYTLNSSSLLVLAKYFYTLIFFQFICCNFAFDLLYFLIKLVSSILRNDLPRNVSVSSFEFSYSISDISLNNGLPNPLSFGGRANNLLSPLEKTTPLVMASKISIINRFALFLLEYTYSR